MCGIAGWVSADGSNHADDVAKMLARVHHRGPDGQGVYSDAGVTLGHRRLSILDLSDRGAQPMTKGGLTVTYNGEIYNYIELRHQLVALGHQFATDCDTEVLLSAYAQWGVRCVERFDGMWAFALHDFEAGTVLCSRDRFGEKPFLYSRTGSGFVFASEVKQLQAVGLGTEPDEQSLLEFICLGRKSDPLATYNAGVRCLSPGTNMVLSSATGLVISMDPYYSPGTSGLFDGLADADVPRQLAVEFQRSVTARLRSDVPVGMLLSGGIDSSLIASVAGPAYLEASGTPLVAVTALTGDPANDESEYARAASDAAQLAWEPVAVPPEATRASWAQATRVIEQPMASSSHVLQLHVMERARSLGCTVLLDGQGADEAWLGYPRYSMAALGDLPWRQRAPFARRSADRTGLGLPTWLAHMAYFGVPAVPAMRSRLRLAPLGLKVDRDWYDPRFTQNVGDHGASMLDFQRQQLQGEQLSALLRYADRTSMALSLEDRLPFLDFRLVELAMATSTGTKFMDGWTKWPLRRQLAETVPDSVAWRKGKIGFEAAENAFQPTDAQSLKLVRDSHALGVLGLRFDRLSEVSHAVLWRLFSAALWEAECLGGATPR